jgi:hypothetical protein
LYEVHFVQQFPKLAINNIKNNNKFIIVISSHIPLIRYQLSIKYPHS